MKKLEILEIYQKLSDKKIADLKGFKLAYAVAKNKQLLKTEYESIMSAQPKNDEYNEYNKKRVKLCEEYSKKDENGKSIIIGDSYQISNQLAFDFESDKLKKEYKDIIDEMGKSFKDFNDFLKEDSEVKIKLHKLKSEDIPEDISIEQMSLLNDLIE